MIRILTRLGELDTEELLRYCEDPWYKVPDVAYEAVVERAGADKDLLKSLLVRINKGLPPYKSSTAVNLLYKLLTLPSETLSAVETDLLTLTSSDVQDIRKVIISSLTAEWVTYEAAHRLASEAIRDPSPAVRNAATEVLRLLHRN